MTLRLPAQGAQHPSQGQDAGEDQAATGTGTLSGSDRWRIDRSTVRAGGDRG